MKKRILDFFKCGLVGWGLECFWTGLNSIHRQKDKKMLCTTSLWMFPIYGMAALMSPLFRVMKGKPFILRGSIYTTCIFCTEFLTGTLLKKKGCCPWDYSKAKTNFKGLIRLDFAPLWFLVGLLYEKVLTDS